MAQIVPSILEISYEKFLATYGQEVKLPGVERIQVDFGDGEFVPNLMVPVGDLDPLNPAFHWEAHLMVREPKDFLDYKICGFKTVIVHFEAFPNQQSLLESLQNIQEQGMEPGLCINPETPVEILAAYDGTVRHFQLMGVQPGFQGAVFVPETFERIAKLRQLCPNAILEVDGGMNDSTIRQAADAGADLIVVGSALTKAVNMPEAYEKLKVVMTRSASLS